MRTETVGPIHYYDICPYIQQIREELRQPGKNLIVRNKYIGVRTDLRVIRREINLMK